MTRLVTAVVDRTHAESGWYGLCYTKEPAPALVDAVGEDLALRLTGRGFYRER